MANQQNSLTGNQGTGTNSADFAFTFPSFTTSEVKVEVDNVVKTLTTHYTVEEYNANTGGKVRFTSGNIPTGTTPVRIFRQTDVDNPKATFTAGSSLKAGEINDNFKQVRHALQEAIAVGGASDRKIQPFNIEDGAITSAKIKDDTIVNADVNASAAIAGTKVSPDFGSQNIATTGTINSVTTTELAILDGATVTTAELNKLDGVTASTAELNILDGVTSTTTELNILDGVTASTAEINKLDGVTATTAELNILDGVTATTTELNHVDGVTSDIQAQLNSLSLSKQPLDAELTELATMSSGTASALADLTQTEVQTIDGITATTAELNLNDGQTATPTEVNILDGATLTTTELNKLDGYTGSTADLNEVVAGKNVVETITGSATDAQIPTAQAVNERVVELVTEVGGFHPIANETSFPTTNPDINDGAGTIVSIKALSSAFTTGSGVTTHTFTNGAGSGNNVTITGLTASTTYPAGRGMLLETTTTSGNGSANPPRAYTYHRLTLDEAGVANAQAVVDDFDERYYGPLGSAPSTRPGGGSRVQGDLYFSTADNQMKVWNNAASQWDDVASSASSNIITLSPSFDGSETEFTCSTVPVDAQSLLLSINGVIQKPNAGTSTPSEGYVKLANGKIKLAAAPASGSDYFAVALGNVVSVGTPSPNTVGATELKTGEIANTHVSSSAAIARTKLANVDLVDDTTPQLGGDLDTNSHHILLDDNHSVKLGDSADAQLYHSGSHQYFLNTTGNMYFQPKSGEYAFCCYPNGKVELYYDNSVKLETASSGVYINGHLDLDDGNAVKLGSGDDLQIYHDGTNTYLDNNTGQFNIDGASSNSIRFLNNGTYQCQIGSSGLDFPDTKKIRIGDSEDLEIQHDGTNNLIRSTTAAEIQLLFNAETMARFIPNGAVELYHDNSKKLETTSDGITIAGSNNARFGDNGKLKLGASDDLEIYHNGSSSIVANTTGDLYLQDDGNVIIGKVTNAEVGIKVIGDGAVELYHNNSKKFETTSTGFESISNLYFIRNSGTDQMLCIGTDNTTTARWSSTRQGIKLAGSNPVLYFHDTDNSNEAYLGGSGGNIYVGASNGGMIRFQTAGSGTSTANRWYVTADGHFEPASNNTFDIGSSSVRVRNIYTNDLHLSNEGSSNDVDSTWGDWTIQEGESDLFLKNNRSGKKYKFNLTEVS